MNDADKKADRLLKMEAMLLSHPEGMTQAEIARRLDVNRSTIGRYLPSLPNFIYQDEWDGNRLKVDRSAYLVNVRFSLHEATAVHLASRLLATRMDRQNPHAAAALRKLGIALEKLAPHISHHLSQSADVMDDAAQRHDPNFLRTLEQLTLAWAEGRKVEVWHRHTASGNVYRYKFSPYFIEPYAVGQSIHVIGFREPPAAMRTFKLERIERVESLPETYTIPDDFDPRKLLADAWGIWYTEADPVKVMLKFNPDIAQRVKETRWHPSEQITAQPDGSVLWEAHIAEPKEMLPWIRGFGADVEVLEPKGLRKTLMRETGRLARVYGVGVKEKDLEKRYYAHSKNDVDESEWQLLKDHLNATGEIAFELGKDAGISELAQIAGVLHDIGKYSPEFQERLRGSKKRVDHATAGAREIVNLFPDTPYKDFAEIISYCIAGHHSGLPDYGSKSDMGNEGTLLARREKKKIKDYSAYKGDFDNSQIHFPTLSIKPSRFRFEDKEKGYVNFSISFLTRMLFSTLTDADWLETERYMQGKEKPRGQHANIETLAEQFNNFLTGFDNPSNKINRKRTETLKACLEKAPRKPGFFTLTVPTGGGKTFASMAFALNHAVENDLKRVIYVIPFTSIIEQNAGEFRKALGDLGEENILEHHSNFDWEAKKKKQREEEADDETSEISKKLKLAAENWDVPIVVTTNVQFFESLFASKKKSARKLHNIAKSVIIFDEAQMLPREYLKPSLLAVQELVQNYGATAVFCTATQPSLERFFPEDTRFTELAPNPQALFDFYRRVNVENLGEQKDEELLDKLNAHQQALCIVNTRKHAKGLYDQLDEEGSFHLSTLMCPVHREETLKEIRQRLSDGQSCRVVSTQVMEAGIDVDFPVGYRALAGLDSIIQAAGRVNREGKQTSGDMFVFTPKTEFIKRTPIFIKQTGAVAKSVLRDFCDDPTSKTAIETYYEQLYSLQSEESFDAKKILKYFEKGIGRPEFDFKTAAENFKFIDNNTVSVIIPFNEKAKRLVQELMYTDYPFSTVRKLQIYTVNIYENEFKNLQGKGVIETIGDEYHVLDESRMEAYYHPKTGLLLPERGSGEAIFFD